jgi:DNA-binding MarR family transcriptional regulator
MADERGHAGDGGDGGARRERLDALFAAGRELSAAAVMFHAVLAARQGLSATEEKALDLLDRFGPLTGRQLSARSGLAPASVTSLVDRLEAKGFARRAPNPSDGRSVLIEAVPDRLAQLGPLFADWVRELEELCARYTDAELAVITEFLVESSRRQREATTRLADPAAGLRGDRGDQGQHEPGHDDGDPGVVQAVPALVLLAPVAGVVVGGPPGRAVVDRHQQRD